MKEVGMVEDWLANAYEDMSRRQFLAMASAAGIGLAGFAIAASSVASSICFTVSSSAPGARVKQ
jgi:hypothetical protein